MQSGQAARVEPLTSIPFERMNARKTLSCLSAVLCINSYDSTERRQKGAELRSTDIGLGNETKEIMPTTGRRLQCPNARTRRPP